MSNADEQMLHRETDALTALLREAEVALTQQNLGVTATVSIPSYGGFLTFGKLEQTWRLLYTRRESDLEVTPLTNTSREARIAAVRALPALYEAMQAQVNQQLTMVRDAQKTVRSFINSLTIREAPPALPEDPNREEGYREAGNP